MSSDEPMTTAQRDDVSVPAASLIAAYESGITVLRDAVAGMTDEEVRRRPVAGKWSTLEVVCHIADCEQFFADRLKRAIAMNRPLLIGADGFLYPDSLRYQEHDLEQELSLVTVTRQQMAHVLQRIDPQAWHRTAVHSETGLVTVRQLLRHAIHHLQHHVGFIAEKRSALAAQRPER